MRINATFIDGARKTVDRVINYDGSGEWKVPVIPSYKMDFLSGQARSGEMPVVGVEVYKHCVELPNKVHVFTRQRDGLVHWCMEQFFVGPDRNTWNEWQRVIAGADRELHANMIHLTGIPTWPGKPEYPPFLTLHSHLEFHSDAVAPHLMPYLFMYHRRTWGVAPKRIM